MRALRPDKLTIAALLATLETYRDGVAEKELPVWRMIAASPRAIATRGRALAAVLASAGIPAETIAQIVALKQNEDDKDDDNAGRGERMEQRRDQRAQALQCPRSRLADFDRNRRNRRCGFGS